MAENTSFPVQPPSSSRRRRLERGLIFAFWTLLAVLIVGSLLLDARRGDLETGEVLYQFVTMYVWAFLTLLIFWLSRRFSIERSNWRRRVPLHAGLALLISLVVDLIDDLNIRYVAQEPWADELSLSLIDALLDLDFLDDLLIYLAVLTAGFARDYFLRYQERRAHAARLHVQLTEARLEALRMQIHPHFLFNTLHAISSLVERDPKGVRRIVARLSDLLRYTLEENDMQEVPLRRELQFLDDYLDIQHIRFQGKLHVERDIAPDTLDALIPSLILQPLIENAIKHGVRKADTPGRLVIRAHRQDQILHLTVRDNGPGFSEEDGPPSEDGLGLRNTRERLEALYGQAAALTLRSEEGEGLAAHITLPFHTATDLRAASAATQS